ncbi:MAG: putative AAA+ superfamily ATPase [Phenylobacterium sp.]|jgi:predicted AAA+ superfamily ATPase
MKRNLLDTLIEWKNSSDRIPVMLDGARQVGKSYLIEHLFGQHHFDKVFKINFEDTPGAKNLFSDSIKANELLDRIAIFIGQDFNPVTDLLFFDEIGLCQDALNSLKYFKEQRPDVYLCASGSNIGLIERYPVGQAYELTLYPMSFYEFVMAAGNAPLTRAFEQQIRNDTVHEKLTELYRQHLFVGGMPAAVKKWFTSDSAIIKKTREVRKIQTDLIKGYIRDFGKYDAKNKFIAAQLEAVFRNIPKQLSAAVDTNVKRFKFSDIIKGKSRYRDFQSLIDYLASTNLISKSPIIDGKPTSPLYAYEQDGRFKLFIHDIGILHALINCPYPQVIEQSFAYKGYMAENFAQNELLSTGVTSTYAWQSGNKAELEFLVTNALGDIIPIEIKSGKNTKAKSLTLYIDNYAPKMAYKLCDLVGGLKDSHIHTRPIYYTSHAAKSLLMSWDLTDYF